MHYSLQQTAMSWNSVPTKHKYSHSSAHRGSLREVKKRLDFQDGDEDENDLDFTDKLKALRGLVSPRKHVLVSRELDKRVKTGSEHQSKLSQKDGETSLKSKDNYKFLSRPASTEPVIKGIGSRNKVASSLSGRYSVEVFSEECIQRPCSAHELASRLDHVDERLESYEFRSPSRNKHRGVVHSTPISKSRTQKATKHEEQDHVQKQMPGGHHNTGQEKDTLQGGLDFDQEKDVNNNKKDGVSPPDIQTLLDRLKKSREGKRSSHITSERIHSSKVERPHSCNPNLAYSERDSVRLERPQSCTPSATEYSFSKRLHHESFNTSTEAAGNRERSVSDSKQIGSINPVISHYKDPSVFPNHERSSKKRDLDSSIRQTNVPFFDEVTTPSGSRKTVSSRTGCTSPMTSFVDSERSDCQDIDSHVPIIRSQVHRSRTPHRSVNDKKAEISGHSKEFQSQKLEYVRNLHNEAVADDQECNVDSSCQPPCLVGARSRRGNSQGSPVDTSAGKKSKRGKVSLSEVPCVDDSAGIEDRRRNRSQVPVDASSDIGSRRSKFSAKQTSSQNGNSEHTSKLSKTQKYLQSLTDKAGDGETECYNRWYADGVKDERKSNLDVGCSDNDAGPMTLRQLRELHNRAFGSSDGKHLADSSNSSAIDSDVEKFSKEYLQHKTTWNREQRSYKRNLQHLNELLDRRSLTASSNDGSSQRHQENGALQQRSMTPASYERQIKCIQSSKERDMFLDREPQTLSSHGIKKHTANKDHDSLSSDRKLKSSTMNGTVKQSTEKSSMSVSTDKERPTNKTQQKSVESTKFSVNHQRSQTPASYERNLKLQSNHSGRRSADLPRDISEKEVRKSVPEKQTTRSPPKLKPRVIKREISPNKFTESNKILTKEKEITSNIVQRKGSSQIFDKRKKIGQQNSREGLKRVVSKTRSPCVTSVADTEKEHLHLDDVRKLHLEVDQRLQDNIFTSCDSGSASSDDPSTVVEVVPKKQVSNDKGITVLKRCSKFENKDIRVHNDVSSNVHRGNRDSVEVSADITIPELFGMKITKTIKRLGTNQSSSSEGGVEVQQWKNGDGNVEYEVTIPSGKQAGENVTNDFQKSDDHSDLVHRVNHNASNVRSSKLHLSENGPVNSFPGQNRIRLVNGIGKPSKDFHRQRMIGEMNENSDIEMRNSQEIDSQRFMSIASQDDNSHCVSNIVGSSVGWDRMHQRGFLSGQEQDCFGSQCSADEEGQHHRVSGQEQDSYQVQNSADDGHFYRSRERVSQEDQDLNSYWHQDDVGDRPFSEYTDAQKRWLNHDDNQNRLILPSERKDFLNGLGVGDPACTGNVHEEYKQNIGGRMYRMVDSRSGSMVNHSGLHTVNMTKDSRLIFEPPERDISTPHENTQLSKLDQVFVNGFRNSPYTDADTIIAHLGDPGAVRLLNQLYSANENVRPNLIIKAQYFKTWQRNVNSVTEHRKRYGHSLQQAYCFHVNQLMGRCFHLWLNAANSEQQNRKASLLYRQMMLRKGLRAFKWAISRSRHHHDIMQSRVESILLTTAFTKWRRLTEGKQRCRLSETFRAWRNLTVEVQSLRSFEKSMNEKLSRKTLSKWKEVFVVRAKQHRADAYSRHTLLKHMFETWTMFTSLSQQQAQRHQLAINQYRLILQKKMFSEMIMVYRKYQKAKWHYGHRKLVQFFGAWQQVIQVCKTEQEQDIQTSTDHWNLTTTRSYFIHWKVVLGNLRAKRIANKNLVRHTFVKWKVTWQQQNERRRNIEQHIKTNKVCLAFRCWRKNVVTRKRRQRKAVALLERQLLQQTMYDWCQYTKYKKELNKKLKSYLNNCNQRRLAESFKIWHRQFQQKVDAERARKFWSDRCVAKCVRKWKHVCRKRRLRCLLAETEPYRQLRCLEVMFYRWLATKHQMDVEKCEASETREVLDLCQLRRRFTIWRLATLQALTIKPLVLRKQKELVSRCFGGWIAITRHKAECRHSRAMFLKTKMRRTFRTWRRQYLVCQLGKQIRHKTDMGLLVCCLQEWSFVLQRKHAAHQFNERKCVRHMFTYWKTQTAYQLQSKADARDREEENVALKRFYFNQWVSNVQEEMVENDDAISMLQQRQAYNRIRRSFAAWRDHLHVTFIGRAYHKNMCQRLMRTVLVEWHLVADHSLTDAVQRFADQLGLPVADERDSSGRSDGSFASLGGCHSTSRDLSAVCDVESEMGVNSPRSASSAACSFRRLFGATESSDRSEPDGMSLIGHGLIDSCQLEEKLARAERIKHIVFTVVNRLRHWPVSTLFDQWKEFTARQLELKHLMAQLAEIRDRCVLTLALREWRQNYLAVILAKRHRNNILLSRTFGALQCYVLRRKEKAKLSGVAKKHHMMVVFQKVFPVWLAKTHEQQHNKHIMHLWSTTTPEEQRLIPLEVQLCRQFSRRSLTVCFSVWFLKHKFTAKIKHAYYSGLIKRSFTCWMKWAQEERERNQKCAAFKERRVTAMTFKTWCRHLQQKRETERRFTLAWNNYLQVIIQTWTAWARANRSRRFLARQLIDKQDRNSLKKRFAYWQSLTTKTHLVKTRCDRLLLTSVVHQWRQIVIDKQKMEQKILEFRVKCYTRLVKVLFRKWCKYHSWHLKEKEEQEAYRQNQALVLARKWRKKAQASRGQRLHKCLAVNKLRACFSKWRLAFQKCLDREDTLQQHLAVQHRVCLSAALETWHTHYLGNQAERVFSLKLQATFLDKWSHWAKASKERRIRGLALQKALEERTLHVYFKYWQGLMQVQQSVRTHVGLKIQIRVLQAWHFYVQRKQLLAQRQKVMTQKVNLRIMTSTFISMRCQFDYCQGLNDIAVTVITDKNKELLRKKLQLWQSRLDTILASRCYGKFLAVRVVRQWRKFVQKRADERQMERDHTELAVRHYNKKICKLAISALYNQVLVSRHRKQHRERTALRFAKQWKHQVDLAHTAHCMEEERIYQKTWVCWRLEFARRKATKSVVSYNRRLILTQIFAAWHHLCQKKKRRKSSIPVAATPGQGQTLTRSSIPVPVNMRSMADSLRRSRFQHN